MNAEHIWKEVTAILDEQLQYGFLQQAKAVVKVALKDGDFIITVNSDEALQFFKADVNKQRLMILSRSVFPIESIIVEKE